MRATLTIALLALAAAGCGRKDVASGTVTGADGQKVQYAVTKDGNASEVTVTGADGRTRIRTGDTAAALPAGFALYPGATVTSSTTMAGDTAKESGTVLAFESPAAPAEIVAFYRAAAERAGYKVEAALQTGEMEMLAGKKAAASFNLTVTRAGDKSSATLIAGAG